MEDEELQRLVNESKDLEVWNEFYDGLVKTSTSEISKGLLRSAIASATQVQNLKSAIASATQVELLVEASMQATYTKGNSFSLPPITLNSHVTPSIGGNERSVTIVNEDGSEKTVKVKIPKAEIIDLETEVWMNDPKDVRIPVKDGKNRLAPSVLGAKFYAHGSKFTYANEFDVQNLAMAVVLDAIQALGLSEEVEAHLEITIYTLRPDMVVVLEHDGRMIFVIEVKSPGKGDEVFLSKNAGGQIWTYLHAMKQLGNDLPMGAIMTYNKIVLVTLEDCGEDEAHKSLLKHTRNVLSTGIIQEREPPEKDVDCKLRETSPIRTHKRISKTVLTQKASLRVEASEFEETEVSRDIFYSKVYEDGEVFPSLVQALEMAYYRCKEVSILKDLAVVHQGDDLGNRLFFKVEEAGYSWVITPKKYSKNNKPCDFCANVGELPSNDTKHFYMLGRAGEGSEGAVYIACNSSARLCAIKVYHIDKSSAATSTGRESDEVKASAKCWEKAKEECKRWKKIYGSRSKNVRALCLGGRPCLLLPYGREIDTPEKRTALLPKIEAELSMIAGYNLRYKDSDLRWRHVRLDSEGKVFLSDLGSLESFIRNPSEDIVKQIARVVQDQMKVLKKALPQNLSESPEAPGRKRKREDKSGVSSC